MLLDTLPAPLEDGNSADAWAEFRVSNQREIRAYLGSLLDTALPFKISARSGDALLSCLWGVDDVDNTLSFAADGPQPVLNAILEGGQATAVAYDEHIKFQFSINDLALLHGPQGLTLKCSLPQTIYRLQRRGAFRAKPPTRGGPALRMSHPAYPGLAMAMRVLDLSTGGCGLQLPSDVPPVPEGSRISGVRLELDGDTRLTLNFEVRRVSEMLDGEGQPAGVRLSCEWQDLTGPAERALQIYVDNLQKRRRMMARRPT